MDDTNEKMKHTVQYWLEVHRIGSLLFDNPKVGDNTLKSLVASIIESPLLSDIECLTGDQKNEKTVAPFTSWLLQGLLKAALFHKSERLYYIDAQSKVLLSTYDNNVFAFKRLIKLYIEGLEKVLKLKMLSVELKFLLENNFELTNHDKCLNTIPFLIKEEADQVELGVILIEVITKVKELVLYHCVESHDLLWCIVAAVIGSEQDDLKLSMLQLLADMLKMLGLPKNENVIKKMLKSLLSMLPHTKLKQSEVHQKCFVDSWNIMKKYSFDSALCGELIRLILNAKESCPNQNFVGNEISFLYSQAYDFDCLKNVPELHKVSLQEKAYFLLDIVANEIKSYLNSNPLTEFQENSHPHSINSTVISIPECSRTWSWILSMYNNLLEDANNRTSFYRLECFKVLVNVACKILGKLDQNLDLSKYKVHLKFFYNICGVTEKIVVDVNMSGNQYGEALELAAEILAELLNFSEMQDVAPEACKKTLDFLLRIYETESQKQGQGNLSISVNHIKSLQSIPPGVSTEKIVNKFSTFASNHKVKDLIIQAVKSVPFLFVSRKATPSRLISEILFRAAGSQDVEVHLAVVDSIVQLVCALAGTNYITRNEEGQLITKCCECSSECDLMGTQGDVAFAEENLLQLIDKLHLSNLLIKKKLVSVLPNLTMHTNILRSAGIFEKFLEFLSDKDDELRHSFANHITSIIFGRSWVLHGVNNQIKEYEIFYSNLKSKKNSNEGNALRALELTFSSLEQNIHRSLMSKDFAYMQLSLLETVTNIACFPVNKVLCQSIQLLLLFVRQPSAPVASIILDVAAAHRTTPLVLFYSFRPEISQFIGNFIVLNRIQYNQPLKITLSEFLLLFKGLTDKRLVAASQNYVLPILILWIAKVNELKDLFYEWANYLEDRQQTEYDIIAGSLQNIYSYVLLTQPKDIFQKCMSVIEELTNTKIPQLLSHNQKAVVNQLLFNYQRDPEKVLFALQHVIGGSNRRESKEQMADKLESRFVGYLLFIVGKFVKEVNADSEKVHAIKSLSAVIPLMGRKHITPVARKVLATLQTISTFNKREFFDIQCEAWNVFITTVDPNELGPLLATIVVSLLPFLNDLPDLVSKILYYIIVKNERAVEKFLSNLIFLPDHPKLKQVSENLARHLNFEGESVKDRLIREMSLVLHETVGVRIEGLKALQKTLKSSMSVVHNLIVGSDEPDPCIKTLLESLMQCCNDQDQTLATLAASCLGELGAVDPGFLPRTLKPKNEHPLSVHDPEFAYLALIEICKGFQNARNSVDMDAFALAIQELLKMYSISPESNNNLWNRFPEQTQSLMMPMLSSRYKYQDNKKNAIPDVIFGSKEVGTHLEWANLWAVKLISFCKDDRAVNIFRACEPSLKRDTTVLHIFLQYILLHSVIRDSSFHDVILKEIEAVVNWSPHISEYDDFRTRNRSVRLVDYCGYPNMRSTITASEAQNCAMTVFLLIDFLQTWLRVHRKPEQNREFVLVGDFLGKIDYLKISTLNYEIREYPRAVMYLEDVISKDPEKLSDHLPLLSKAYALYGDLDSVAGASTFQKTAPKMEDLLLSHQVSGQMEEVRIIYERLGKDGLMTPAHMQEMVQCYLNLEEPFTAYNCIKSFAADQPDLMSVLSEGMAESLIKLGDYSQLSKFLEKEGISRQPDWFIQIGRIVVNLHEKENEVLEGLSNARTDVANVLKQTHLQMGDFQQGYPCLIKLQILNEIERVYETIENARGIGDASNLIQKLTDEWDLRSGIVQSDPHCLEPLMSMRRILLGILKEKLQGCNENILKSEVGKYWVKSGEIARKAKCFHQAYNCILNAEQYNIPSTFIEKAQLFWDKGNQDQCLFTLNRGIKEFFPDDHPMFQSNSNAGMEERKMCAEAKLLYAVYNEETSNCTHETNIANYKNAFQVCQELEKSHVFFAQCLDRVATHLEDNEQEHDRVCEFKVRMVLNFGNSLKYGYEYIYQTVPRMLSIWLDLGEKLNTQERKGAMLKINKLISKFTESLPPFVMMTALPQLLSRLGHPNSKVFQLLKDILIMLVRKFPQQCLWSFQVIAKSQVPERTQRYREFIQDPALRTGNLQKLISDFTNLCEKLNKLTNRHISEDSASLLKVSSIVKELPQLLASERFSAIIIPITRFCSISLPRCVTATDHEPFPKKGVYIVGIEDEMMILHSLQKPRKILFRGNDGKLYDILCKPKDDLRRDSRLMEFNNIVNMYLHRDPESRARRLHIRTYMVVPLGENGGLLEWVTNLEGLRKILVKLYKSFGKFVKSSELRKCECQVRDNLEKKRQVFLEKLLPMHQPIFPEWFRLTFPDPPGWYIARQSYIRTTAVISMVGYILGLGDRHGENILLDSESGDTVHVDFNCLFNQGERFDWKERVPFRLTHNMVAAMGPLGVEGTFRKSCEISLRVLRSQNKTLMSVLTPFAYDPFGSWGKNKEIVLNERDKKISEAFNELTDIEKRLNGSLRINQVNTTVYLSVEGQVRSLIQEATNVDNLCQMFIGWGAYL